MIQAVFILVLASILVNWLYKKQDNTKLILKYAIQGAILVLSIVALGLGVSKVVFVIYYSWLILSSATKLIANEFVLKKFVCEENKEKTINILKKIELICFYVDALFTVVATCFVWRKVTYIILAIAFLLVLIMVHEFGHYIFGKMLGFKINEFSIGFGPAIFQKKKQNGEVISLRTFPLGGYCAFEGEDEEKETEGAFNAQKPWKRLIVLFGGVFFNFIFGIITSVAYLSAASYSLPQIVQLAPNSTSAFAPGDVVVAVEGNKLDYYRVSSDTFAQFSKLTSKYEEGQVFTVTVIREGQEKDIQVKKEFRAAFRYVTNLDALKGQLYIKSGETYTLIDNASLETYVKDLNNNLDELYKAIEVDGVVTYEKYAEGEVFALGGITQSTAGANLGILQTRYYQEFTFGEALLYAVPFGLDVCWLILKVLGGIFTGATAVADLGGTVTAVDQIAELTSLDIRYMLYLLPMISMNLAVFNILPFPALDGARMVFVLIEMIRKKPINKNVEGYIHTIGLFILLALVVFLDVYHFVLP